MDIDLLDCSPVSSEDEVDVTAKPSDVAVLDIENFASKLPQSCPERLKSNHWGKSLDCEKL
jgi:hypothetical protein